ncbi:MAG: deaminase [Modestobacter sp.]|jgi:dihydrofolate reductase|nr:deaminase [Modestobacter sp.]
MAALIYNSIASLDGYVADTDGSFAWAEPDAEVHRFVNQQEEGVGTYFYGRRTYETMAVWDTDDWLDDAPPHIRDYARIWRAADKVVYSTTLAAVTTDRTRIERTFDPAAVRQLVDRAERDVGLGGPTLAAGALHAGLVDECSVFVVPVVVGGGTPWLPAGLRLDLDLVEERRFAGGVVLLRYRTRR